MGITLTPRLPRLLQWLICPTNFRFVVRDVTGSLFFSRASIRANDKLKFVGLPWGTKLLHTVARAAAASHRLPLPSDSLVINCADTVNGPALREAHLKSGAHRLIHPQKILLVTNPAPALAVSFRLSLLAQLSSIE